MNLTLSVPTSSVHLHPEPLVAHAPRQLLTPLPTPGHFLLVIDNSSLEVFTTCPKAADYKLVRRREAPARDAALTFGGAVHEGVEKFLHAQYVWQGTAELGPLINPTCYSSEEQNQAILRFFTENPAPLDDYRTVTNALAVLSAYRERSALPDYHWEILSDAEGPIIERAFELPLGVVEVNNWIDMPWLNEDEYEDQCTGINTNALDRSKITHMKQPVWVQSIHLAWSGRIDAVARCGDPRIARVVDHKTGMINPQEYRISNPVLGYVWAARQLWPDLDIGGFCLNGLATKRPSAGCSMTSVGPRGGKPALELSRSFFEYSQQRLNQWEENVRMIVSDFIHNIVRNFYPRATKWCFDKYGQCPYYDVCCQDDPQVRSNMLQSDMFRSVTWNPVAGR